MTIYLIRHGETAWNAARIVQLPETPLNENGHQQAGRVAHRMKDAGLTAILSSDYQRTQSTAEAIAQACGVEMDLEPLLRERHFGDHRGNAMADIGFDIFAEHHEPPNGESWPVFRERVRQAWDAVLAYAAGREGNLAVVTHGLVLRVLADQVIPLARGIEAMVPHWPNTCVTQVDALPEWRITRLACGDHLEGISSLQSGPVGI